MKDNGRERRKFPRADFPCEIYILTAPLHIIKCKTENIGAGGIRVFIDEELSISSSVGLKLFISKKAIECKGKVVWKVERNESGQNKFDTGLEFHQISEEDRKIVGLFVKSLV